MVQTQTDPCDMTANQSVDLQPAQLLMHSVCKSVHTRAVLVDILLGFHQFLQAYTKTCP